MGSIIIKLDPQKLLNPDTDIRYIIPNRIEELTSMTIRDNGYDYLDDKVNSMLIFLKSDKPKVDVLKVYNIIKEETFKGNNIYKVAEVYLSEKSDDQLEKIDYNLSEYELFKEYT